MDIRFRAAAPTDDEREAVDAVLGAASDTAAAARVATRSVGHRHLLLPALHALQDRAGWITEGGLDYVCRRLGVPPAEAYGVATFYALFSLQPRPPRVVHVCVDLACLTRGAGALADALERHAPASDRACVQRSACLGLCDAAPAALVTDAGARPAAAVAGPADVSSLTPVLDGAPPGFPPRPGAVPQAGGAELVLLRRIGVVDPTSVDSYRAAGGYEALRRAFELGPAGVLRELLDARLVGRGGAAFPTARKWEAVARQPVRPHYLVCNADESEPGTFKDRVLLEGDPFAVVEAMTVAGVTTGCEAGLVYVRGEYALARERVEGAVRAARARGLLGDDVMGRGVRFDIEVRRGAGAYICGEETALFNSIEGYRGEPRSKPPFPSDEGLWGKPTLVNNVETLVNVLPILVGGGAEFATTGKGDSTGPKLFAVAGCVVRPGVYEVPFGATLREVIELAGGLAPARTLRAVLLGGAAGTFVRPADLDVVLTFEGVRAIGATLGSGAITVLDDTAALAPFLLRIAGFFRDESCGQCVPCRVGTVRQEEALERLVSGAPDPGRDLAALADLAAVMRDASICGLGQTAANAVQSAVQLLGPFERGPGS